MGDLDTRKHDVDIIERVLGVVRDRHDLSPTHVVDIRTNGHSTVELTVGLADDEPHEPRAGRRRERR